jgi:hypothetical protein
VPNPIAALKEIEARGARLFVVDPRRTETAKAAGEHVFIRPGTDVFFYLAFLNELCAGRGRPGPRRAHMTGFDEVAGARGARGRRSAPPRSRASRGEAARDGRRRIARADGAALYCSTGVNMGGNGSLAFWLQEVINAVAATSTRGGTLVGRGSSTSRASASARARCCTTRSRIGGFAAVNDAFPGGCWPTRS